MTTTRTVTPLTAREARETIQNGQALRVEAGNIVIEGLVGGVDQYAHRGMYLNFTVNGFHVSTSWPGLHRVDGPHETITPTKRVMSDAEILALIGSTTDVVPMRELLRLILGFEITLGFGNPSSGGKTAEQLAAKLIDLPALKRSIDTLVAEGRLVKAASNMLDSRHLTFGYGVRAGWVTAENDKATRAGRNTQQEQAREEKYRAEAERIVGRRYADEVEIEIGLMRLAAKG